MSRKPEYPNDADGDALRRVAADGSDMSLPMEIDFAVAVPSQEAGERVAAEARRLGFVVKLTADACDEKPDASSWSCYCTKSMVPAYDALLKVQQQLDEIAAPW